LQGKRKKTSRPLPFFFKKRSLQRLEGKERRRPRGPCPPSSRGRSLQLLASTSRFTVLKEIGGGRRKDLEALALPLQGNP
jgi:hypothetical protein